MSAWRYVAAGGIALALLGGGFWYGRATAETNAPGSAADPLVSKSYVDQLTQFRVVNVPAGQMATGAGGTEIVLRAGQATAVASTLGGLLDVTSGTDIKQGETIVANHLLVVPRTDGRGLKAVTELVLMVRGPVTVAPQN